MIFKILTWFGTIISIVGFVMYLLDKINWWRFKNVSGRVLVSIVIVSAIISIIIALFEGWQKFSRREIQAAASIMGDMSLKLQAFHNELYNLRSTKENWHESQRKITTASSSDAIEIRKEFNNYLIFRLSKMDTIALEIKPSPENIRIISKTDIPLEEINVFYNTSYPKLMHEIRDFYLKLKSQEEQLLTTDWLNKNTGVEFDMLQASGEMFYFSLLELVAEMPKKVKDNFYEKVVPFLTQFPVVKMLSKQEAKILADRAYNQYSDLINKYSAIVGSEDINVKSMEQDVSRIQKKIEINNTLKEEVDIKKVQLKQVQESLRQKCKLLKEDGEWLMWGKIIKLATAKMYDDAIISLDKFLEYNKEADPNSSTFVKSAKAYYSLLSRLKKENKKAPKFSGIAIDTIGIMVVVFENQQVHSCLKIGDIILFNKNHPIRSNDEFIEISKKGGERLIMVYRLNETGQFDKLDLIPKETDPKIGLCNLHE